MGAGGLCLSVAARCCCVLHRSTAAAALRHSAAHRLLLLHHSRVDRPPASRRTARNADTCAPDTVASVSQQKQTDDAGRPTERYGSARLDGPPLCSTAQRANSQLQLHPPLLDSCRLARASEPSPAGERRNCWCACHWAMRAARLLDRRRGHRRPHSIAFAGCRHRCTAIGLRSALVFFPAPVRCGRMLGSAGA